MRFGEMLGYSAKEVSQLHVWDWDVQWTREELLRILQSADESGNHFETRHRRKDGTLLDVEISGNGAMCTGRKLVFCVCRDISRRKQAEKDIRNLNANLERRVAERTSELVAANAELARAARLKDEFLASMSHELRTPLNGILTMSESLQEQVYGSLNAGQGRAIRDIEECGRHLLALINDILDVAKIEAGKIELETHPVSVESLCQSSLRMVKDAAHKKKIGVSLAVDETVPVLIADERRVKQILVNLLSNAVKFTPQAGKIGLHVVGDRLNHQLRFTVWDTGIGVSAEEQPRLFKPFSQLDSGLCAKIRGNRPGPGACQTVDRNARWQCGRREPARPGKPVHRIATLDRDRDVVVPGQARSGTGSAGRPAEQHMGITGHTAHSGRRR